MGKTEKTTRSISAHNLPMSLNVPRVAAGFSRNRPAAAFLTQLLQARSGEAVVIPNGDSRASAANSAYRSTESSDIKRMPMGYRKTMSA